MVPGSLLISTAPHHHVPPGIALLLSESPTGACEIMWNNGTTSIYSYFFLKRNFKVLQ
jgi:hypothetical protein